MLKNKDTIFFRHTEKKSAFLSTLSEHSAFKSLELLKNHSGRVNYSLIFSSVDIQLLFACCSL